MSYWPYNDDVDERRVQCYCGHIFRSKKDMPQCSNCKMRFYGNERPFKTTEERERERKTIYELISSIKTSQNNILTKIKQEQEQNEKSIRIIENLLKPFN